MATISKFTISKDLSTLTVEVIASAQKKIQPDLVLYNSEEPNTIVKYPIGTIGHSVSTQMNSEWESDGSASMTYGAKGMIYTFDSITSEGDFIDIDLWYFNSKPIIFLNEAGDVMSFITLDTLSQSLTHFIQKIILPTGTKTMKITHWADEFNGEDVAHTYNKEFVINPRMLIDSINLEIPLTDYSLNATTIVGKITELSNIGAILTDTLMIDSSYQFIAMTRLIELLNNVFESNDGMNIVYDNDRDMAALIHTLLTSIDLAVDLDMEEEAVMLISTLKNRLS